MLTADAAFIAKSLPFFATRLGTVPMIAVPVWAAVQSRRIVPDHGCRVESAVLNPCYGHLTGEPINDGAARRVH